MDSYDSMPDTSMAIYLAMHIDNPCSIAGEYEGISREAQRDIWISLAESNIPEMQNPFAIDFLIRTVRRYRTDFAGPGKRL